MRWYAKITRQAEDWGHGDTLDGQQMRRAFQRIEKDIERLRKEAYTDGLEGVMPRWRGELKRKIMLLPPISRVSKMSMYELNGLRGHVDEINAEIKRYNQKRFTEVMFGANSS